MDLSGRRFLTTSTEVRAKWLTFSLTLSSRKSGMSRTLRPPMMTRSHFSDTAARQIRWATGPSSTSDLTASPLRRRAFSAMPSTSAAISPGLVPSFSDLAIISGEITYRR
jgi:hypothetical protein